MQEIGRYIDIKLFSSFIYDLLNEDFGSSDYVASNEQFNE